MSLGAENRVNISQQLHYAIKISEQVNVNPLIKVPMSSTLAVSKLVVNKRSD